jgi:hypothetical protein
LNIPAAVGVPLKMMESASHTADTPSGRPVMVPMPVAPVVLCLILGKTVFKHKVGETDAALAVFDAVTVIVPVATGFPLPQFPVNGMV